MVEEVIGVEEEMLDGDSDGGDGVRCGSKDRRRDSDRVMTLGGMTVVW